MISLRRSARTIILSRRNGASTVTAAACAGTEELGLLVHRPGGTWAFDYDPRATEDDEPGYRFDKHRFAPGEYVSLKEHDGVMRTFRIVSVVEMD
jgi:hypothetical protein